MDREAPTLNESQCRETDSFVTLPEASRRTHIGLRQFRRGVECGELAVFDVGAWPRVRWSDVLDWIEGTRRSCGDLQRRLEEREPGPGA